MKKLKPPKQDKHFAKDPGGQSEGSTAKGLDAYPFAISFYHALNGWKIDDCEPSKHKDLFGSIRKFSAMTWKELRRLPRENGFEDISGEHFDISIPDAAKRLVPENIFKIFRFGQKSRLIGFRDKETAVFHVLWVDPDHKYKN